MAGRTPRVRSHPPDRARRLRIPLRIRASQLHIEIEAERVVYSVSDGEALTAVHRGQTFTITAGEHVAFPGEYRTLDASPDDDRP